MNKIRFFGLLLVVTGIVLSQLQLKNNFAEFLMGLFVGSGLVFLITGQIQLKSKK